MKVLSLFSGGGLGDYGLLLAGMQIAGQVEIDEYCQKILQLRFPESKKWRDIKNVKGEEVLKQCGKIDLISGGFPCQPFSLAGKRRGKEDDRYLWPEMLRIISEVKPAYVFGENVIGIVKTALDQVLSDLEGIGYTCQAFTVPACGLDAPHRRDRVWIIAYSGVKRRDNRRDNRGEGSILYNEDRHAEKNKSEGEGRQCGLGAISPNVANAKSYGVERRSTEPCEPGERAPIRGAIGGGETLADSASGGQLPGTDNSGAHAEETRRPEFNLLCDSGEGYARWPTEPAVGRVANGIANRVDRLKLLGNGQVVQVVEWFGRAIMEFDQMEGALS